MLLEFSCVIVCTVVNKCTGYSELPVREVFGDSVSRKYSLEIALVMLRIEAHVIMHKPLTRTVSN